MSINLKLINSNCSFLEISSPDGPSRLLNKFILKQIPIVEAIDIEDPRLIDDQEDLIFLGRINFFLEEEISRPEISRKNNILFLDNGELCRDYIFTPRFYGDHLDDMYSTELQVLQGDELLNLKNKKIAMNVIYLKCFQFIMNLPQIYLVD